MTTSKLSLSIQVEVRIKKHVLFLSRRLCHSLIMNELYCLTLNKDDSINNEKIKQHIFAIMLKLEIEFRLILLHRNTKIIG